MTGGAKRHGECIPHRIILIDEENRAAPRRGGACRVRLGGDSRGCSLGAQRASPHDRGMKRPSLTRDDGGRHPMNPVYEVLPTPAENEMSGGDRVDARCKRHAHELREALGPHLLHDPGTVDLHGARADRQLPRDRLIRPSDHQLFQDLALALRQPRQAPSNLRVRDHRGRVRGPRSARRGCLSSAQPCRTASR